jgi:hypothetical protein
MWLIVIYLDLAPLKTKPELLMVGRLKKFGLKRTQWSSTARACRKAFGCVLNVVNGKRLGMMPTDSTVSLVSKRQSHDREY